jgi:DNA repair protein RadD
MNLRWYQTESIASIYHYFSHYTGNPIVALPTGTGKSCVIAEFLRGMYCSWPASRVMMLTHIKELIAQNFQELIELWPTAPAGIYSAGLGRKEVRPIVFAGIKSVVGKGPTFGHVDLVVVDECHLVSPADDTAYESFIGELRQINPRVKVVGLTATPYRLGQGLLTEATEREGIVKPPIFSDICYDLTSLDGFNRLIAEGYLAPLIPRQTAAKIDVSEVDIRGGEFVAGQLQAASDKEEVTYAAVQEMVELGADRKHWLIFATGQQHCEHVVSALESMGIPAACVHSKTPASLRDSHVADFKAGKLRALVNNNIFTAGFNFRAIDMIGVLRPTSSPGLWVQMLGRGTRPFPGKENCLVLDFAGNTRRLGPINDPVIPKRRRKKGDSEPSQAPVKLCPHCATWNHNSARVCMKCGEEFPPAEVKITANSSTDALIVGSAPVMEVFRINSVEYRKHSPHYLSGKQPSLKVEYFSGLRCFQEWVCLEHTGYPAKKARDWWRNAAADFDTEPPATVDQALSRLEVLQRPTHVRVWVNCKTPRIMAYDYSGTAFGTQIPEYR